MTITDSDIITWKALPYKDHRACCKCGQQAVSAGRSYRRQKCLKCFAGWRHRSIGQKRANMRKAMA